MDMKNKKIEIKRNFKKNKTGISPVITTVLLIALVIVIIGVIFLWFSGMVEEGVTKFGKNIQLVCDDVSFDASYSSGILNIVNNGNVPLYDLNLKIANAGAYTTKSIKDLFPLKTPDDGTSWPKNGLNQGGTFSGNIQSDVGNAGTITVFPILIGTSTSGKKTFVCEGQYGKALSTS
jgi:FlaG/FlaF family flagellin (archaellin)